MEAPPPLPHAAPRQMKWNLTSGAAAAAQSLLGGAFHGEGGLTRPASRDVSFPDYSLLLIHHPRGNRLEQGRVRVSSHTPNTKVFPKTLADDAWIAAALNVAASIWEDTSSDPVSYPPSTDRCRRTCAWKHDMGGGFDAHGLGERLNSPGREEKGRNEEKRLCRYEGIRTEPC